MKEIHRPVKLYALSTCIHCKDLIEYLERHQVNFSFVNVDELEKNDRKDMIREVKRYNKKGSFPTLVIGDQVVVGFREAEVREALDL